MAVGKKSDERSAPSLAAITAPRDIPLDTEGAAHKEHRAYAQLTDKQRLVIEHREQIATLTAERDVWILKYHGRCEAIEQLTGKQIEHVKEKTLFLERGGLDIWGLMFTPIGAAVLGMCADGDRDKLAFGVITHATGLGLGVALTLTGICFQCLAARRKGIKEEK